MLQRIHRKASGVYTWPNRLLVPEGALGLAQNVSIDREGILSTRRGYARHCELNGPPRGIFEYLFHRFYLDGSTIRFDSDGEGTLVDWAGTFEPPPGRPMTLLDVDGRAFFTTSLGVFVNDSLNGTPRRAGMERGLDIQVETIAGDGTGIAALEDAQIGWRLVWGREELPPGAPTEQERLVNAVVDVTLSHVGTTVTVTHPTPHGFSPGDEIQIANLDDASYIEGPHVIVATPTAFKWTYNDISVAPTNASAEGTAGKRYNVLLTSTIPEDVQAGDWYEVYRSHPSADADTIPFDEHFLLKRVVVTDADIAAGFITFTDDFDEEQFFGVELYTNETAEGLAAQNDRPPFCERITHWRNHLFYYGSLRREHFIKLQLLKTEDITPDSDTITIGGEVYTFSTAVNLGSRKFETFQSGDPALVGFDVRRTAKSLCHVINRTSVSVYAFYISGIDEAAGQILIRRRTLLDQEVLIEATTDAGTSFSPEIGDGLETKAQRTPHRVGRAKFQKPDAAPELNTMEIGKLEQDLLNGTALKESVIIFAQAGAFEITGETDGSSGRTFLVREVDTTLRLLAPETLVALDNSAIGWTSQGIVRVNSSGSAIVSRPIEDLIQEIQTWPNFGLVRSISYESYHKLLLLVPSHAGDDTCVHIRVWDYLNNTWSGPWVKPAGLGLVAEADQKLYLGHAVDSFVLQERKTASEEDYYDEDIPVMVTSFTTDLDEDGNTVSVVTVDYDYDAETLSEGWLFRQDDYASDVVAVVDNGGGSFTLTLADLIGPFVGAATVGIPIPVVVKWLPETAGNLGALKRFNYATVVPEEDTDLTYQMGFLSDVIGVEEVLDVLPVDRPPGGYGLDYGNNYDSGRASISTPRRVWVPRNQRKCRSLAVSYRHSWARQPVNILELVFDLVQIGAHTTQAARTT